ncbi:MAG: hypothetical protein U0794_12585 [Isosphaeraceae bacterium]
MKLSRVAAFALGACVLLASTGCRTAGLRDVARPDLLPPPRLGESAESLLAEHNRNAERVSSFVAKPSITVHAKAGMRGGVSGKMAFEREKNFKLVLSTAINDVADIGSNDKEFWFWVKDNSEPGIYYCNYDPSGSSPLASSLQPDWIVEALGLRVVSEAEAKAITIEPGKEPGTLVLTHKLRKAQGKTFVKETVLSESTHRIREHRILTPDKKTLLAQAVISQYQELSLPAEGGQPAEKVVLPKKMRLVWTQEGLTLDVALSSVQLNPPMDDARRAELFVEPELKGIARRNLAELAGIASTAPASNEEREDRSSVRQSMPAPPPRVRLSEPSPVGRRDSKPARDGSEIAVNLPPAYARGVQEVIGPPIPRVSDPAPAYVQVNSGWRSAIER